MWDEAQVAALATGDARDVLRLVANVPADAAAPDEVTDHQGTKYAALTAWLADEPDEAFEVSFGTLEEVLGFPLPPSCRRYVAHWHGARGSAVARAIKAAGWRARHVDPGAERLVLERERPVAAG